MSFFFNIKYSICAGKGSWQFTELYFPMCQIKVFMCMRWACPINRPHLLIGMGQLLHNDIHVNSIVRLMCVCIKFQYLVSYCQPSLSLTTTVSLIIFATGIYISIVETTPYIHVCCTGIPMENGRSQY